MAHRETARRWLPRNGEPTSPGEMVVQWVVRALGYLPVYTALIVTVIVLIQVFGVPWR